MNQFSETLSFEGYIHDTPLWSSTTVPENEIWFIKDFNFVTRKEKENMEFTQTRASYLRRSIEPEEKPKQVPTQEQTIKALEASIAYWNRIYLGEVGCRGGESCPLCQLNSGLPKSPCAYCPISNRMVQPDCLGTPYHDYVRHHSGFHGGEFTQGSLIGLTIACGTCAEIVKNEIKFLESVLKEEKAKTPRPRYFLRIEKPYVAIGEDSICLHAVDEKGNHVFGSYLLQITAEGKIQRFTSVNKRLGLSLDIDERVEIEE